MSLIDRIRECQNDTTRDYVSFVVDGILLGQIHSGFVERLAKFSDVFETNNEYVNFTPALIGYADRSEAIAEVLTNLRAKGLIPGWRNELYPAGINYNAPAFFEMERAAVPLFGVRGYGVHMNGWLTKGERTYIWVARRSLTKPTGPGKLDQMVGGGQPARMSLRDNLMKECGEEAGMPLAIAADAKAVGTVSYKTVREEGLRNDVLFNFDLQVPIDFEPVNNDGEVAAFMLWEIKEVIQRLNDTDDFKFNSALVMIDFLVRHGFIDVEDPDYSEIVSGLHM